MKLPSAENEINWWEIESRRAMVEELLIIEITIVAVIISFLGRVFSRRLVLSTESRGGRLLIPKRCVCIFPCCNLCSLPVSTQNCGNPPLDCRGRRCKCTSCNVMVSQNVLFQASFNVDSIIFFLKGKIVHKNWTPRWIVQFPPHPPTELWFQCMMPSVYCAKSHWSQPNEADLAIMFRFLSTQCPFTWTKRGLSPPFFSSDSCLYFIINHAFFLIEIKVTFDLTFFFLTQVW